MEIFEAKESSNVHWARYENGALFVDFKNKKGEKVSTYCYDGTLIKDGTNPGGCFPRDIWARFCMAESKGRYFAAEIRNVYRGVKQ